MIQLAGVFINFTTSSPIYMVSLILNKPLSRYATLLQLQPEPSAIPFARAPVWQNSPFSCSTFSNSLISPLAPYIWPYLFPFNSPPPGHSSFITILPFCNISRSFSLLLLHVSPLPRRHRAATDLFSHQLLSKNVSRPSARRCTSWSRTATGAQVGVTASIWDTSSNIFPKVLARRLAALLCLEPRVYVCMCARTRVCCWLTTRTNAILLSRNALRLTLLRP